MTAAATKAGKLLGAFLPGHKVTWVPRIVPDPRDPRTVAAVIVSVADDGGPLEKNGYVRVFLESDKLHKWVRKDELHHRDD